MPFLLDLEPRWDEKHYLRSVYNFILCERLFLCFILIFVECLLSVQISHWGLRFVCLLLDWSWVGAGQLEGFFGCFCYHILHLRFLPNFLHVLLIQSIQNRFQLVTVYILRLSALLSHLLKYRVPKTNNIVLVITALLLRHSLRN